MRLLIGLAVVAALLLGGCSVAQTYNSLVSLDQAVQAQWAQVQTVYQRRADLIPNLVATVKGVANFEKSTYIGVAAARAKAGQVSLNANPDDAQAFQKFQAAQDGLTTALSRLLVVVERYPELKANENYLDLQAQLEGTENRIAVERHRYNDAARGFNVKRQSFPTTVIAGVFAGRFKIKPYFEAAPAAQQAPTVNFGP